jgi:GMP synthase-like glutamine amidotransferase
MRILGIEHERNSGTALLGERAVERGIEVELGVAKKGLPPTAAGYDALIVMGASPSVNDAAIAAWFEPELDLLRDADRLGVPVFGVCFGAQALAIALGGSVQKATRPEIGWVTVDTDDPVLIAPGPWMQWHSDAITPPPGATVLARSGVCVQAYVIGPHLAVQFHPEVTEHEITVWAGGDADQVRSLGLDPAAIVAETRERAPLTRPKAHALFDRFIERVELFGAGRGHSPFYESR